MIANSSARFFLASWENLNQNKYWVLLNLLKELGATKENPIKFDWKEQYAPCIVGECFEDDINDCYVKSVYADGDCIYVSLWAYYRQESKNEVLLYEASHEYTDLIRYLVDWTWDDNFNGDWEDDEDSDWELENNY